MHKTNSQFETSTILNHLSITTVLTSALHNVYLSLQAKPRVCLFVELFVLVFVFGVIVGTTIRIWPNTLNPLFGTALVRCDS